MPSVRPANPLLSNANRSIVTPLQLGLLEIKLPLSPRQHLFRNTPFVARDLEDMPLGGNHLAPQPPVRSRRGLRLLTAEPLPRPVGPGVDQRPQPVHHRLRGAV